MVLGKCHHIVVMKEGWIDAEYPCFLHFVFHSLSKVLLRYFLICRHI